MSSRRCAIALTTVLPVLLVVAATADTKDDLKHSVQSEYNAMSRALVGKDADAYAAHFADDFTFIGPSGKPEVVGRQHVRDHWRMVFQHASNVEDSLKITDFQMEGPSAVATSHEEYTRTYSENAQGGVFKEIVASDFRDFWVKTKGTWLLKRERTIHSSKTKTQNGQVVSRASPDALVARGEQPAV